MARIATGLASVLLAGALTAPAPSGRLVSAQEAVSASSATVVQEVREIVASVAPVRQGASKTVSESSAHRIAEHEVGSAALYTRKYQRPIYPGYSSGPTIGVGYDLGTQASTTIRQDWSIHPQVESLQSASGLTGANQARPWVAKNQNIVVPWPMALDVYRQSTLPRYYNIARRSFGQTHFDAMPQGVRDALTSLVYNRGGSMAGSRRVEMRTIRDVCLPSRDVECVARNIELQCRLWEGTAVYNGLCKRRKDEANMARGVSVSLGVSAASAPTILMLGDSLMGGVAIGMQGSLPGYRVIDRHKVSSGLVNLAFYDWVALTPRFVADAKPDYVVLHFGANDGQDMRDGQATHRFGSADWVEAYQARIHSVVRSIRLEAPQAQIVWLGLPAMGVASLETKTSFIERLHQGVAQDLGIPYVSGRDVFGGGYLQEGRAKDGVHYTRAGGKELGMALKRRAGW